MKQYIAKSQQKSSKIQQFMNLWIIVFSFMLFQAEYVLHLSGYKMTEFKRAFDSFDMESLSLKIGNDIFTKWKVAGLKILSHFD